MYKINSRNIYLLITFFICSSFINVSLNEGYIKSVEDIVQIEVKTNETPVYGVFQWSEGLSLWVRVYGQKKKLLDNLDLSNSEALILQGKGKFLLELYSQKGKGNWNCKFLNEKEYQKLEKKNKL
jgi:hypothetical protein